MALKIPADDGGYVYKFLGNNHSIKFPLLTKKQKEDQVKFLNGKTRLDYVHYSVVMCKSRKLAYFTAVNIDGTSWKDNPRKGDWDEDPRVNISDQLGKKLYNAVKSNFDRGHMVRREDPEWGEESVSIAAGENTFWFPNCAPQHKKLNQEIWADLEANILHNGADEQNLKVSVFTGPVLAKTDGIFVTKVQGEEILIPNLFWKVVVWTKSNGKAYAVGFIQSQEKFLLEAGIIIKPEIGKKKKGKLADEDFFEHIQFKDGKTYQVRLEEIESLTGLKFDWPNVVRPFKSNKAAPISGTVVKPPSKSKLKKGSTEKGMKIKMKLKGLIL